MLEEKQNTGTKDVFLNQNHTFFLKKVDSQITSFVQVDFSPITPPEQASTSSELLNIHPSFNQDGHHFTPAFILPLQQQKTEQLKETYLRLQNQRRVEMSQQREQLFVPKPSKANSFCCICKKTFEDYLTHVSMPFHQQLLQASPFRCEILSLSLQFNTRPESPAKEKKKAKSRRITKNVRKGRKSQKVSNQQSSTTCNSHSFEPKQIIL